MRRCAPALLAVLLLAGCRGTVPAKNGKPEQGIAAVLIGGRIILPTGEIQDGSLFINLEGEGGREAEVYRLPVPPQQAVLYQVEPGNYRLAPTRSIFGRHQASLKIIANGRRLSAPFPREVLRKPKIPIRPTRIVSLGVLEAQVMAPRRPSGEPAVRVRLDDSIETRRRLVERTIRDMMNPEADRDIRDSAVSWTRALENSLSELLAETQRSPLFKPSP